MSTALQQTTETNISNTTLSDLQRIARSLQRSVLLHRYSHGTIKRSAMAMINLYLRSYYKQQSHHHGGFNAAM